jgi:cytochrome c peroxidase
MFFLPYQANAFGDVATASDGINGTTTRHSMIKFQIFTRKQVFWDERAVTLELQTTQPIQNHIEMGVEPWEMPIW